MMTVGQLKAELERRFEDDVEVTITAGDMCYEVEFVDIADGRAVREIVCTIEAGSEMPPL